MTTRTITKIDPRIVLTTRTSFNFSKRSFELIGYVGYLNDEGQLRWGMDRDRSPTEGFADLQVHAYSYGQPPEFGDPKLEYRDVFCVNERRATVMAKTLRTAQRRMDTHRERFGYPQDTAGWLVEIAAGIGARSAAAFGVNTAAPSPHEGSYKWMSVDALRSWLTTQIADYAAMYGEVS